MTDSTHNDHTHTTFNRDMTLVRGQILPRLTSILTSSNEILSLIIALVLSTALSISPLNHIRLAHVVPPILTTLGFMLVTCAICAAVTVAMSHSTTMRTADQARTRIPRHTAYLDLVFTMVWALIVITTTIVMYLGLLFIPRSIPIAPDHFSIIYYVPCLIITSGFIYSIVETMVVYKTMMQIAVYVHYTRYFSQTHNDRTGDS